MANLITATVINIGGNPLATSLSQSFLTSGVVIQAATISSSPTAVTKITYFSGPFSNIEYYSSDTVTDLVALANTGTTSMVQVTVYKIKGYDQKSSLQFAFPASGIVLKTVVQTPVVTIITCAGVEYGVSETEGSIVTAANVGGGGSSGWAVTGTTVLTGSVDIDGSTNDADINFGSTTSISLVADDGATSATLSAAPSGASMSGANSGGTSISAISVDSTGVFFTFPVGTGTAKYSANYSANFTARSLIDKGYVDTRTGTPATGRIPYGASATALTYSAALAFDGTDILTLSGSTIRSNSGSWLRIAATAGTVQLFNSGTASSLNIFNGAGDNGIVLDGGLRTIATGSGTSTMNIAPGATEMVGIGITPTAKLHIAASTTARASLNIATGAAPTAPNDQDFWFESNTNTGIKVRINGVTKTITVS